MFNANLLLGLVAAVAVSTTLLSCLALLWVTRGRRNLPDHTPPVTIYKPLKGVDEGLARDKDRREARLRAIRQLVKEQKGKAAPQWYVNGQGQTMVVIPNDATWTAADIHELVILAPRPPDHHPATRASKSWGSRRQGLFL